MNAKVIDKKITGFSIKKPEPEKAPDIERMHEKFERPESLEGSTYKIKTPLSDHALYITINDVVLNPGTDHEVRRPFEIFINSKNLEHFQCRADPGDFGGIPEGRRCHLSGRGAQGRVRSPGWVFQIRRPVHAIAGGGDRRCH